MTSSVMRNRHKLPSVHECDDALSIMCQGNKRNTGSELAPNWLELFLAHGSPQACILCPICKSKCPTTTPMKPVSLSLNEGLPKQLMLPVLEEHACLGSCSSGPHCMQQATVFDGASAIEPAAMNLHRCLRPRTARVVEKRTLFFYFKCVVVVPPIYRSSMNSPFFSAALRKTAS